MGLENAAADHRLALVGFAALERRALVSLLRMAARVAPRYALEVDIASADILVVDADRAPSFAAASPPAVAARSIFVGKTAPANHLAHMPRPLDLMALLHRLDKLALALHLPEPSSSAQKLLRAFEATVPDRFMPEASNVQGSQRDKVLVVDGDADSLRIISHCLPRMALQVQPVAGGELVPNELGRTGLRLVFLDGSTASPDVYRVCREIKSWPYALGRQPPKVILLVESAAAIDRTYAASAGVDGCLIKPFDSNALVSLLGALV